MLHAVIAARRLKQLNAMPSSNANPLSLDHEKKKKKMNITRLVCSFSPPLDDKLLKLSLVKVAARCHQRSPRRLPRLLLLPRLHVLAQPDGSPAPAPVLRQPRDARSHQEPQEQDADDHHCTRAQSRGEVVVSVGVVPGMLFVEAVAVRRHFEGALRTPVAGPLGET